jgi:flagellar basal-body rod protein FlgB
MSDLGGINFGNTVDTLRNAISGADLEHKAIAENIANVNTPNNRRQTVSFKDALAAAAGDSPDSDDLAMATDSDRQFGLSSASVPFDPQMQVDETDQMRVDGSNVDIDQETAELSENSGYSQTMSQLLQVQFMRLREAATEQA